MPIPNAGDILELRAPSRVRRIFCYNENDNSDICAAWILRRVMQWTLIPYSQIMMFPSVLHGSLILLRVSEETLETFKKLKEKEKELKFVLNTYSDDEGNFAADCSCTDIFNYIKNLYAEDEFDKSVIDRIKLTADWFTGWNEHFTLETLFKRLDAKFIVTIIKNRND